METKNCYKNIQYARAGNGEIFYLHDGAIKQTSSYEDFTQIADALDQEMVENKRLIKTTFTITLTHNGVTTRYTNPIKNRERIIGLINCIDDVTLRVEELKRYFALLGGNNND